MMDFDYVVAPILILIGGSIVIVLVTRRLRSLRVKRAEGTRQLFQRITLTAMAAIAFFAAASSGVNAVLLQLTRRELPGNVYIVHGRRMRINCVGEGSPTIVLEAGGGNDGLNWEGVQPMLARTTRVCSYDRAGYGGSDAAPPPRDADHIAEDLHELLHAAGIQFPAVLMGHSIGGLFIRDYASHYPTEVAGLIFEDSSTPGQFRNPVWLAYNQPRTGVDFENILNRIAFILGVPRLLGECSKSGPPGFGSAAATATATYYSQDRCHEPFATISSESDYDLSANETISDGPFGSTPILIFSHDPAAQDPDSRRADLERTSDQMAEELKKLSTRSRRIIAKRSAHYVHFDRADLIETEVPLFIRQIQGKAPAPAWETTVEE
jgi:pimeloyl-ACP methyl ester carboxylesterase